MTEERKYEILKEKMDEYCWNDWELVSLWNEYCEKNNYYDDRIFSMDEFNELYSGCSPLEILDAVDRDFNTNDDWFKCGIYGCESFDYISDSIDMDSVIEYIIDNDDNLYDDTIQSFLDEIEELEEEDEGEDEE